ncbi:MAG: sensor histidine kinase, partial [Alphaproteobacteria bacterium]
EDADGATRIFHISGVPVFDGRGRYAGYRGAGLDVTDVYQARAEAKGAQARLGETLAELGRARLELSRAATQAEHSTHAKEQFLAIVNHELRTPLNAIIGFADAMRMQLFGALGERYQGYCRDILDASQHLLGLIEDILDASDFGHGTDALALADVKLADVLDEARALVEARAVTKRIDIGAVRADADWRVRADRRRLKQILVNLLANAVKFTPIGGTVGVDVARDGADVAITVWDTGIGIAPDKHEAVFGKFEQLAGHAYARSHEGTGLGLHISRALARAMGGDIRLDSAPDTGSRFSIILPAVSI